MKNLTLLVIIISVNLFPERDAVTATIYQWTDENGLVHFSDVAPAGRAASDAREIIFDGTINNNGSGERYSIIEQADMMANWRRAITAERIAEKKLHLEEKRMAHELEMQRLEHEARMNNYYARPHYYVFPQPYFNHHRWQHDNDTHEHREQPLPRIRLGPPPAGQSQAGFSRLKVSIGY